MGKAPAKSAKRSYGLEDVERGLVAYAYALGNKRLASKELKKACGLEINPSTLRTWATETHRERYEQLRSEILPRVGARVADEHLAAARESIALEGEIARKLKAKLDELPAKELSTAQRNVATSAGIHTSRARELQGDVATPHKVVRDANEVMRKLIARGVVIDGEAEEIQPPELEEGD